MSTYTPIASQTLGSSAATVTFSSIPQNYTDLVLIIRGGLTSAGAVQIQYNGDTSSNYSNTSLFGYGSGQGSSRLSNQTKADIGGSWSSNTVLICQIQNYSNSSTYKTAITRYSDASDTVGANVSLWRKTPEPITSITLTNNSTTYVSGTVFTLYGVAAGNSSAKATGGNIVTTDGSYWYHAFTSSGTFTPSQSLTCDYVVVAGGGGGGTYYYGGGGGAGGYRSATSQSLSANTVYPALVGAGGFGGTSNTAAPTSGIDSTFVITSAGGGRGGSEPVAFSRPGISGGSGGGGDGVATSQAGGSGNTPSTSPSQGNNGGTGVTDNASYGVGGGGGGATSAGSNASGNVAGAGGTGSNVISTWLSSLGLGASGYLAGGGGGGSGGTSSNYGAGGSGGGGAGGNNASGTAGSPNTGGGGGGSGGGSGNGGQGGSGVIVIRYAV